jgi:hypothetical protein
VPDTTADGWIICTGFLVHLIDRQKGRPARFRMTAFDSDGNEYGVDTKSMSDSPDLVRAILGVMTIWPKQNWEFRATGGGPGVVGTITEARPPSGS